jgi:hypothetical protein
MTIERAADIIREACDKHGVPITREIAREMALSLARMLSEMPDPMNYKPGEIARFRRDRYEGEDY